MCEGFVGCRLESEDDAPDGQSQQDPPHALHPAAAPAAAAAAAAAAPASAAGPQGAPE